mgnify:CR=1 FL=1
MLRLMIVDDEEIIRTSISKMIDFESIGYELVATAKNGMEAYDILRDEYPDVIITDIRMPVLNGLELIEKAKNIDSNIDFILLSGYGEFDYARQAMQYGVRYYLLKPTDSQELISSLIQIRQEREEKQKQENQKQRNFLDELQFPLQTSFIIEALSYTDFTATWQKYQELLSFPDNCQNCCICSFIEESFLDSFVGDARRYIESHGLTLSFPVIYVKNSVIFIFPAKSLLTQEVLQKELSCLSYPKQSVEPMIQFLHFCDTQALFETILKKISRYSRIFLLDEKQRHHEIRNNLSAPWKIEKLGEEIFHAQDTTEITELLTSTFSQSSLDLETAQSIALSTYMWLHQKNHLIPLDNACDFFRKVYSCSTIQAIYEQLHVVAIQQTKDVPYHHPTACQSNVALIKSYVQKHLNEENLSLKWLAEHYLFISVRNLSKQFIQEEGERFSDYLNRIRMEEAKKLLLLYNNDNIKDIARQVGFGNNPRYFGQVFKRYTGCTPSDFLAHQQDNPS